jgi:hypothetical protein
VSDDSAELDRLFSLVQSLQRSVDQILELLKQGQQTKKEPSSRGEKGEEKPKRGPIDWMRLSGDERLAVWEGLAVFVESLVHRYNLQLEILPCWWRHPDAVEELTALWQIRQNVFGERDDPTASYQWQNQLYNSRERLSALFMSCREGHIGMSITTWMTPEMRADFQRAMLVDSYPEGKGRIPMGAD